VGWAWCAHKSGQTKCRVGEPTVCLFSCSWHWQKQDASSKDSSLSLSGSLTQPALCSPPPSTPNKPAPGPLVTMAAGQCLRDRSTKAAQPPAPGQSPPRSGILYARLQQKWCAVAHGSFQRRAPIMATCESPGLAVDGSLYGEREEIWRGWMQVRRQETWYGGPASEPSGTLGIRISSNGRLVRMRVARRGDGEEGLFPPLILRPSTVPGSRQVSWHGSDTTRNRPKQVVRTVQGLRNDSERKASQGLQ